MARTSFRKVAVHDFRVLDQSLFETDPEAGNVVYMGPRNIAYPFAVARRISGPSGMYVDTCRILAPGGFEVAELDRTFELEGESIDTWIVDAIDGIVFPGQGPHTLQYLVFGEPVVDIDFEVFASERPYAVVMPGPVDAALSKGTIAWLSVPGAKDGGTTKPVWYGYEGGRVYVLTGEREQRIAGIDKASAVRLQVRSKDKQSLVGDLTCSVRRVDKDAEWDRLARDVLIGRRLNLTDGEAAIDRWRATCEIYALTPTPGTSER